MLLRRGSGVLAARLVQAALNALAGWFVADRLGPEAQGSYTLSVFVIMVVAALLNGGVGLAAVPLLRAGSVSLRGILRAQLAWSAWVGAGLGAAAALVWKVGGGTDLIGALGWAGPQLAVGVLAVVSLLLFDVLVYDLNARGRVLDGPRVNTGRALLFLAAAVGWIVLRDGEAGWQGVLLIYAVAQASAMVAVLGLVASADRDDDVASGPTAPLIRRLLKDGWLGQLSSVVSLLHLRFDLALVAAWHGVGVVGVYSVAVLLGELLWLISGALQPVLVYTASAVDDAAGRDRTTARAVRLGFFVTAIGGVGLWLVAPHLLRILFGTTYLGSVAPLRALLPGIVCFSVGAVLAGDFIGRGRPAWNTQASLVTVVVNLGTGVWLIPAHGALGAAWASTFAYVAGSLMMLLRFRAATALPWGDILRPRPSDLRSS